jgi:acetyltransferase
VFGPAAGDLTGGMALAPLPPAPRTLRLRNGRSVRVRPIAPSDAEPLRAFDGGLSEASHRFRYQGRMPRLTSEQALAMASVDFARHYALVATAGREGEEAVVADCRLDADEGLPAELAVAVADDHQCLGLGPALIRQLLEIAAGRGIAIVEAQVHSDNRHMLHVLRRLGFRETAEELGVVTLSARTAGVIWPAAAGLAPGRSPEALVGMR